MNFDDGTSPRMTLEPGQRVVWTTRQSSRILVVAAVILMILGVVLVLVSLVNPWFIALPGFGIGTLMLSSVRVSASANGLDVRYGYLPWPSTTIKLDEISEASAIDVNPIEWGGWGYRGTLKVMGKAAVVLRKGPGLRLDLRDGRVFVVTLDDPETPAALLNGELARTTVG